MREKVAPETVPTSLEAGRARARHVTRALHESGAAMRHSAYQIRGCTASSCCRAHCQRVSVACCAGRIAASKADASSASAASEPAAKAPAARTEALSSTDCTRAYAWPNGPLKGVLPAETLAGAGSLQLVAA
jgi:hypothetical protein